MFNRKPAWLTLIAVLALALLLAACGDDAAPDDEPDDEPVDEPDEVDDADDEPVDDVSGEVTILHAFTGEEDVGGLNAILDDFMAEYPNVTVLEEGTGDFESLARTRIGAGNPPDIILHPQPGLLEDFWNQGVVEPLDDVVDRGQLEADAVPGLLDLVTFNDELYGVPLRLSLKSLVWYSPATFEAGGYEVPETWDDLMDLTEQMAADDVVDAPWCIGMESGDATGWVATDWVEDLLLRTEGPEAYDQWVAGELLFSSDEVKNTIEEYMEPIWFNDEYVFGGTAQIPREPFGTAVNGILTDPPECGLHRQATFIEGFIEEFDPDAEFGVDYDFFYFPGIDPEWGNPTMGGGDFAALYTDNEAAEVLLEWLTTPESGEGWAAQGGFLSPFAPVFDDSVYPSDSARTASEILAESDSFRFDGSDLMPGDVGASSQSGSFWIEMTEWVAGQKSLDDALAAIDELYAEVRGD